MLVFHRKSGQGAEIKNKVSGRTYSIDYMYLEKNYVHLRINRIEIKRQLNMPFYLDGDEEVMIVPIQKDSSFRLGIDAKKSVWNIRRKEVPETVAGKQ
jgi:sRNA-binding carbon storage regulator CsrA